MNSSIKAQIVEIRKVYPEIGQRTLATRIVKVDFQPFERSEVTARRYCEGFRDQGLNFNAVYRVIREHDFNAGDIKVGDTVTIANGKMYERTEGFQNTWPTHLMDEFIGTSGKVENIGSRGVRLEGDSSTYEFPMACLTKLTFNQKYKKRKAA